jgi:hypothetical protein
MTDNAVFTAVRDVVSALNRGDSLLLISAVRALAMQDENALVALCNTYPTLTMALLMIEERLGMLQTSSPALDAAIAALENPKAAGDAGPEGGSGISGDRT